MTTKITEQKFKCLQRGLNVAKNFSSKFVSALIWTHRFIDSLALPPNHIRLNFRHKVCLYCWMCRYLLKSLLVRRFAPKPVCLPWAQVVNLLINFTSNFYNKRRPWKATRKAFFWGVTADCILNISVQLGRCQKRHGTNPFDMGSAPEPSFRESIHFNNNNCQVLLTLSATLEFSWIAVQQEAWQWHEEGSFAKVLPQISMNWGPGCMASRRFMRNPFVV